MKIMHIGLSSAFTENMTYQDNLLSDQNRIDGHEVLYVSDCHKYKNGKLVETEYEEKILENGIRLIRLPYHKILNKFISGKIRKADKLEKIIKEYKPDVILYHGVCGYELKTVAKYKKENTEVKLYVDSHEDFHNSGTNFVSRQFLHKGFNRKVVQNALPYIDKILCVSYECYEFLNKMYKVPENMMELYPLGGTVFPEKIRQKKRMRRRAELGLKNNDILLVHSGKMDKYKRTADILKALKEVNSNNIQLAIIGALADDVNEEITQLIKKDSRVKFLGWKNSDELLEYLCASDLYIQPGGQSATMQNAACCGSALALYPYESHKVLMEETCFYINTIEDMVQLFKKITEQPNILDMKRLESYTLVQNKLDYKILAKRLYT